MGKIRYKDGWVVIDCPYDIMYYYNRICNWLLFTDSRITMPLHGAHITVVAGKYTKVEKNWGYRDGESIEFQYGSILEGGNEKEKYFWLPVKCDDAVDIRLKLGLDETPKFPYHLTIGHLNLK
jgi:hypothetical protein